MGYLIKMKLLLVLVGLMFATSAYSQEDSVFIDSRFSWMNKVHGIPDSLLNVFRDGEDTLEFVVEYSVEDSLKYFEGSYFENRKEGWWVKYHKDGRTPKLIGKYHNNRPEGIYFKVYPSGTVKESGTFHKGKYCGELKKYYESGCLKYSGQYNKDGLEVDTIRYYFNCDSVNCCEKGQIEFMFIANEGKPSGTSYRYYPNGNIMWQIDYDSYGVSKNEEFFEDEVNE